MLDDKCIDEIRGRLEAVCRPGYSGVLTQGHVDAGKLLADRAELRAKIRVMEKSQTAVCIYCSARFNWDGGRGDALRAHVQECGEHPLRQAEERIKTLQTRIAELEAWIKHTTVDDWHDDSVTIGGPSPAPPKGESDEP